MHLEEEEEQTVPVSLVFFSICFFPSQHRSETPTEGHQAEVRIRRRLIMPEIFKVISAGYAWGVGVGEKEPNSFPDVLCLWKHTLLQS